MKSLSQEKIAQIGEIYSECNSLRETCRRLNISIGSAHKYTTQLNIVNTQNIVNELKSCDQRLIGLYIGLWMGDGTQYYDEGYTVKICSNKKNVLLNKFIQESIFRLFGKNTRLEYEKSRNNAYIRFESKFIFNFVYKYISRGESKTHTVRLREDIEAYSVDFLEGCLLGLILTDGYLKRILSFSITSSGLADNLDNILKKFVFHPYRYIDRREQYTLGQIYIVKLSPFESRTLRLLLDNVLKKLDCKNTFQELKYEK